MVCIILSSQFGCCLLSRNHEYDIFCSQIHGLPFIRQFLASGVEETGFGGCGIVRDCGGDLEALGVRGLTAAMTGDELDAVTAALVGRWFLRGQGEMFGGEEGIVMPMSL